MGTHNSEPVLVRVPITMTKADRDRLVAYCEDEVRSVGSWFRWVIRRAWRSRKPPRRPPDDIVRVDPTLRNKTVAWARLTESERDQLEVLCADEGVAPSIWFRRRLEDHWRTGGRKRQEGTPKITPTVRRDPRPSSGRGVARTAPRGSAPPRG